MRIKKYIPILIILLAACVASCGEDRTEEYMEMTQENQWTYATMKEVYLWADEIKQPEYSQFFTTTVAFFKSLLNINDRVSFFTDTIQSESYGISALFMRDPIAEQPSKVYALTLFVEPESPAAIAGIKRGTWISEIDGKALSISGTSMLQSGGAVNITTEQIKYNDEDMRYFWSRTDTIAMSGATDVKKCNICLDSIYNVRGKKAGYILCNNFYGNDFIEKTENILLEFATEGVTDIILDLRYNSGGSMENAAAFAGAFVPTELHGTPFAILKKNDEIEDTVYNYMPGKTNLCDKRLFIITGKATSGVAELFISSVDKARSMYEVMTIGETTKGDNIIVKNIVSPYGFSINPAVAFMYTADDKMLPAEGLKPDYPLDELTQIEHIYQLGSEQEYILYNTLYLIVTGSLPL